MDVIFCICLLVQARSIVASTDVSVSLLAVIVGSTLVFVGAAKDLTGKII